MLPMIVPIDEDVDIIQYLQHGFVSKTNVETPYPTLNLSRHVPLTNMQLSVVYRVSFNNVDSTILARQSGVSQRVASEIPGSILRNSNTSCTLIVQVRTYIGRVSTFMIFYSFLQNYQFHSFYSSRLTVIICRCDKTSFSRIQKTPTVRQKTYSYTSVFGINRFLIGF